MGYTHYWTRHAPGTVRQYADLARDVQAIAGQFIAEGGTLANALGQPGTAPDYNEAYFALNGDGDDSHETFYWPATVEPGPDGDFNFTKTSAKPYDAVVTAALCRAATIYGDDLAINSDGTWEDWAPGRRLYLKTFGVIPPYVLRRHV